MGRMMNTAIAAMLSASAFAAAPALAKTVEVQVDARSAPWSTGANRRLAFGLADAKPPKVVWDLLLLGGGKVRLEATGQTTTEVGGRSFGPAGDTGWPMDRGAALFPSHYIDRRSGPVFLNGLVGAFIDADGKVVGKPFSIGERAEVEVPDGASALSLGLNDDRYSDNSGTINVRITTRDPKVIVEGNPIEK